MFSAVDRDRVRGLDVLKATLDHSRGQVQARRLSLVSKAEVFRRIETDALTSPERRERAALMARHYDGLARLYAARVDTYRSGAVHKTSAWLDLVAARRWLASEGLAYRPRHALRDLACGVLLGRFASTPGG